MLKMEFSKPAKLLLGMFIGFCVLSVLVFLSMMIFFPATYKTMTPIVNESVSDSDSSGVDGGKGLDAVGRPDELIDPAPGYSTGGDGSKLVKNSTLSITVDNLDNSIEIIKNYVIEKKGFVQSLSDSGTVNNRKVSLSIRVPSASFDEVLGRIKDMGIEVLSISEGSSDISETYADIQARLKTQKALEKQLLTLLNRATKISDILEIQTQLTNVRTQIEMYESQLKNYDSQVDMSVIYISLSKASQALDVAGDDWKPVGVFKEALTALVAVGKGLVTLSIWIIVFSPIVLIPAGLIWYATRKRK